MPLATRAAPPVAVRRWLVGVCLSLLVVAGCSGGSGSGEEPESVAQSETESASPTTPSPSPTTEPWEKRTKAGAVAFVKHWVDVFNEAGASGDTRELRKISAEQCDSCVGYADMIDKLYARGGELRSDGWTVREAGIAKGSPLNRLLVGTRIRRSPEVIVGAGGDQERFPGGAANYTAFPRWREGWVMTQFVNAS